MNVHIKPGSIFIYQNNSLRNYTSAQSILDEAPISLVVARDQNYFAKGEVYLDNGVDGDYEHYEFYFQSFGTINKFIKNVPANPTKIIDKIVIPNAIGLSLTNFACY